MGLDGGLEGFDLSEVAACTELVQLTLFYEEKISASPLKQGESGSSSRALSDVRRLRERASGACRSRDASASSRLEATPVTRFVSYLGTDVERRTNNDDLGALAKVPLRFKLSSELVRGVLLDQVLFPSGLTFLFVFGLKLQRFECQSLLEEWGRKGGIHL